MIGRTASPPNTAMNPEFGIKDDNVAATGFSFFTGGGGGGTSAVLIYTLHSDFRNALSK